MSKKYLVLPLALVVCGSMSLHAVKLNLSLFGVPVYTYNSDSPHKQTPSNLDRYLQQLAQKEATKLTNNTSVLSGVMKQPSKRLSWRGLVPEFTYEFGDFEPCVPKKADAATIATVHEALKHMGERQPSAVPVYAFRKDHPFVKGLTNTNGIYISEHNKKIAHEKYIKYHEAAHWFHRHPHKGIAEGVRSNINFTLNANPLRGAVTGLVLRGLLGYFGASAKLQQLGLSAQASHGLINGLCLGIGLQHTFDWQPEQCNTKKRMAYMLQNEKEADRTAMETLIAHGMIDEVAHVVIDFNNELLHVANTIVEKAQALVNPCAGRQPIYSYFKDYQLASLLKAMDDDNQALQQRLALEKYYLKVIRAAHEQEQAGKPVDYKAIVDKLKQSK